MKRVCQILASARELGIESFVGKLVGRVRLADPYEAALPIHAPLRVFTVPYFCLDDITRLALATGAPFAPLLLTVFSPEELVTQVLKVVL